MRTSHALLSSPPSRSLAVAAAAVHRGPRQAAAPCSRPRASGRRAGAVPSSYSPASRNPTIRCSCMASLQQPLHAAADAAEPAAVPAAGPAGPGAGPTFAATCARPQLVTEQFRAAFADVLQQWPSPQQQPLVYHKEYNISFFGIEKLHPFDSCKFKKVVGSLQERGLLRKEQLVAPQEASQDALAQVHTREYLHLIHTSNLKVVQVTELAALFALPNKLLQWRVVNPMKRHVGGTIAAAGLAIERGWAVNIGGGMHHAYSSNGMGWCPFDDIGLAVKRLRAASGGAVQRVLYIDLDAHQGNGLERDKLAGLTLPHVLPAPPTSADGAAGAAAGAGPDGLEPVPTQPGVPDRDLFIVDLYNGGIFPLDDDAKPAIDVDVPLRSKTRDAEYLAALERALAQAAQRFPQPDLVVFNAGTDVLEGDPLGRLGVTAQGVLKRDAMVWDYALHTAQAPILMTLSGGYTRASAQVIADSLAALAERYSLLPKPAQA